MMRTMPEPHSVYCYADVDGDISEKPINTSAEIKAAYANRCRVPATFIVKLLGTKLCAAHAERFRSEPGVEVQPLV